MVLVGKLTTELGIKTPADKFFDLFATQHHEVQNLCEKVHAAKLHEGDDWHAVGKSVKHWTYTIDGKTYTCHDTLEVLDKKNKKGTWKLFGGDIDEHYKLFRLNLQVIENKEGGAIVIWTIEYEKKNEDIDPPNGYIEFFNKCTRDIDAHFLKA